MGLAATGGYGQGQTPLIQVLVPTTTSISATRSSSFYGENVLFLAQVSSLSTANADGTVTFYDRNGAPVPQPAPAIGSATLVNGTASLFINSLPAGSHLIFATYGGSSNFDSSSSGLFGFTVSPAPASVTVTASPNPSFFGQAVSLTATVTAPQPGTPSGSVTFTDGANTLGSVTLSGGQASFITTTLAAGTHTITAVYGGDSNFTGGTSGPFTQTVNSAALTGTTQTAVISSLNPSVLGQSVTFSAVVNPSNSGTPTGTVTFKDGFTTLGTGTLNGQTTSFITSSLSVGTHSIIAVYSGDSNFTGSTSTALPQTVNSSSATNTTTSLVSSLNPSALGQSVTFMATVTPTGSGTPTGVVVFWDGGTELGNFALNGGHASLSTSALSVGTHSITAVYGGDSTFSGSTSSVLSQTVTGNAGGATSTSISSSPNPANSGQAVTFTATVTSSGSGNLSGSVTFEDGATTLGSAELNQGRATLTISSLAVGAHSITAVYGGDSTFSGSTSPVLTQTIGTGAQTSSTTTSALAHFAAGGSWTTGIFVVNTGNQAGKFSLAFYGDDGSPVTLPFSTGATSTLSGSIPANGSAYFEAADPQADLVSGWARITADPSLVVQAMFRDDSDGTYHEAAVPSSSGSHEFLLPFDATTFAGNGQPFFTGFAVANLDASTANVSCIARDSSGALIANAVPVPALNPLGHWANYLFPVLAGRRGTIDCSSNTNIAGIALRVIGSSTFSSLPVVTDPSSFSGGANAALAHFAAGDTWTTGFFVLNTSTSPAQFSITFHDDTGNPVALPFSTGSTDTLSGTVPGHGSAYYEAGDSQAPLLSGSAQITADPAIVVQALFRDDSNGTYYEAAVPSSSGSHEFLLPFDMTTFAGNGQPSYTGFAVANLDQTPADVTCTARDQNGVVIPNAVPVPALSPLGHWTNYLFPALTGMRGTIDCVSGATIAATALQFIGSSAFSSLPVITK